MIRKLAITGAVLLALGAGADLVAQGLAESAIADNAGRALGLEGEVEVDIQGFPVLLDLLGGEIEAIDVSVRDHEVEGLRLTRVGVRLERVRAEGSWFGDGPLTVVSQTSSVFAETDTAGVNAFMRRRGQDARVELLDGEVRVRARRTILGVPRTFVATGPLRIEGNELVFVPRDVRWDGPTFPGAETLARQLTTVREPLPQPPGGVALRSVRVAPDLLRFEGAADSRRFVVRT